MSETLSFRESNPTAGRPEHGQQLAGQHPRLSADPQADYDLRINIEHEAAHATVYLLQGVELGLVSGVEPLIAKPAKPRRRNVRKVGIATAAGLVVEARYRKQLYGKDYDIEALVAEHADWLAEEEPDGDDFDIFVKFPGMERECFHVAKLMLDAHSDLFDELSNALWDAPDHRLTGKDIEALPIAGKFQKRARERSALLD